MNPEPVTGGLIMIVAFVGILINGVIALLFRKNTNDLNIRGAYINMFYDMLASVGALLAGLLIILTRLTIFDSIISLLIGVLLLRSSWDVIRDAMHVLLEGVPEGMNGEKVKELICKTPKVKGVDDMHLWAISSHYAALSCHIIIEDCEVLESIKIVKQIKDELKDKLHIEHATIETELTECLPKE
jgi:cobalt-zinc-cadmium efflux system protein